MGLHLDAPTFRALLNLFGPSLGLWRAAEVAVLRQLSYERPILDLGCGDGLVTSFVLSRVDVALDPDPQGLARAARLGIYERYEASPAEKAAIAPGSMATIFSNSVLEHVARIDELLMAVAYMLRPGGRFVFTSPTEAFGLWLAVPSARYAAQRNRQLIHLNLWSVDEWTRRLAEVGLEVEEVCPYLRRPLVAYWDAMDMLERVWLGRYRLVGLAWRRLSPAALDRLACWASRLDLAAEHPGGGRLIAARKR